MRVVVTGATGNVGSQVVPHLLRHADVTEVVGMCRRPPRPAIGPFADVRWVPVELGTAHAVNVLRDTLPGADVVVHLAWRIQPSHDVEAMRRVNVLGSRQVLDAVAAAGVPALVHASSVGAYSAGPKDRRVDETWPTGGIPTSSYSRHKAEVERLLDAAEERFPALRIVRMRPGLIFQTQAGSEIARYFLGPLVPVSLLRRRFIPVVPRTRRLCFQAVHTEDVGRAFALAVTGTVRGPINVAGEPVLDPPVLAELLGARPVPVPAALLRLLADVSWRLRLQPSEPGWLDLGLGVPLMDTTRARTELGWAPEHSATGALLDLLEGMQHRTGGPTPPLHAAPSAPRRLVEVVRTMLGGGPGAG